jgi:hypothetical protein
MKRWMLTLIICIPLASVAFGAVMLYFALHGGDVDVMEQATPLSKVSWQEDAGAGTEVPP